MPKNVYPNDENYPTPSFKRPVTAPDVDPDEGAVVIIGLNPEWIPVVEGALDQLLLPSTWEGTHDEINTALNRASNLKMLVGGATTEMVGTPYWDDDDAADADDQQPVDDQDWYGELEIVDDELTFFENAQIWVIAGLIASTGAIGAAVAFVPIAQRFTLAFKKHDLGGIIRAFIDAEEVGTVDTYDPAGGVAEMQVYIPTSGGAFRASLAEDTPHTLWVQFVDVNPAVVGDANIQVIRQQLTPYTQTPKNLRYRFDDYNFNGVEITLDGGATWNFTTEQDTRYGASYFLPAVADDKCNAAARCAARIREQVEIFEQTLGTIQLISLLIAVLDKFMLEMGLFVELITDVAGGLAALGEAAISAAFTDEQYDLIMCAVFCNCLEDGTIDDDATWQIWLQIDRDCNTTVSTVIYAFWWIWGTVGWNNMAQTGDETGDCDDCNCTFTYCFDFRAGNQTAAGWAARSGFGHYVATQGWESTSGAGLILECTLPSSAEITRIDYDGTANSLSSPKGRAAFWRNGGTTVHLDDQSNISSPTYTFSGSYTTTVNGVWLNPYGGTGADIYVQHCTIYSNDEIPAWAAYLC